MNALQSPEITVIRPETDAEFQACLEIRHTVFVEEQAVPEEDEYDGYDATAHHFLAVCDAKPCGAARWRRTDHGKIKLERFAVLKEFRGKGVGKKLVEAVLASIPASIPAYLHAQVDVIEFYKGLGFSEEGEIFDECGILHRKMNRILE